MAGKLRAALVIHDGAALTSLIAQLRIPVGGSGKVRNVDVLHLLYTTGGLRKSREFTRRVERDAVLVELDSGVQLRVMHPLDVLESRVQNAVGLVDDKGEHVITQARWAIAVARSALLRVARSPTEDGERIGRHVQRVFRLWKSPVGQRLWNEHRLCVLDALDVEALSAARSDLQAQLAAVQAETPDGPRNEG